jgi:hypothetical protein
MGFQQPASGRQTGLDELVGAQASPVLAGQEFETAIEQTEGFSFAQLRETYILGAQSAFEHGRDIGAADVIEAIELQAAGAQDLKTSVAAPGFVRYPEPSASRK